MTRPAASEAAVGRSGAPLLLEWLHSQANPANVAGMARYGIRPQCALGVSAPALRTKARDIGRDHDLALELWKSGVREARILAALVAAPSRVTRSLMERWARDFDSWDVCDAVCCNLFDRTPLAWGVAGEWTRREPEFVKRAGFVLMAALAVHDKDAPDRRFVPFLKLIERQAADERNFVKKAVNWALRQVGKRSPGLRVAAVRTARRIAAKHRAGAGRWIAADALRELQRPDVRARVAARSRHRPSRSSH